MKVTGSIRTSNKSKQSVNAPRSVQLHCKMQITFSSNFLLLKGVPAVSNTKVLKKTVTTLLVVCLSLLLLTDVSLIAIAKIICRKDEDLTPS